MSCNRVYVLQLLKATCLESVLCNMRKHCNEKPEHLNEEQPLLNETRESPCKARKTRAAKKIKYMIKKNFFNLV